MKKLQITINNLNYIILIFYLKIINNYKIIKNINSLMTSIKGEYKNLLIIKSNDKQKSMSLMV